MWTECVVAALAVAVTTCTTQNVTGDAGDAAKGSGRKGYTFYRGMERAWGSGGTRRIFGGLAVELESFPLVVALLDRYWAARCSGTAVASHWVLTAAHCVTPRLAYVKYNTRRPASPDGDFSPIHFLYRHPKFEVVQTQGAGADVTLLHHDVGLVRVRDKLRLRTSPPADLIASLRRYNAYDLSAEEVEVLGFGRTERSVLGEELFSAHLQLQQCGTAAWVHCVCGAAGGEPRGVCSGDSGGPVLYRGVQVGVTSMGPVQCARAGGSPPEGSTSVFTSLYQYAEVVNATVTDAEAALRMARVSRAAPSAPPHVLLCALLPLALLLVR